METIATFTETAVFAVLEKSACRCLRPQSLLFLTLNSEGGICAAPEARRDRCCYAQDVCIRQLAPPPGMLVVCDNSRVPDGAAA